MYGVLGGGVVSFVLYIWCVCIMGHIHVMHVGCVVYGHRDGCGVRGVWASGWMSPSRTIAHYVIGARFISPLPPSRTIAHYVIGARFISPLPPSRTTAHYQNRPSLAYR